MATLVAPPPGAKAIGVRPLRDECDAKAAAGIIATCFAMDKPEQVALEAALTEEIQPPVPHSVRNFLALIDGHPVGTASSVYLDGSVGLIGGSTLPEARGQAATEHSFTHAAGKPRARKPRKKKESPEDE